MGDAEKFETLDEDATTTRARKQKRSLITRQKLLGAARRIFAQQGFEPARLEEIAAAAGKTRGAFYANFDDKEDVFFAIFEEDLAGDEKRLRHQLSRAETSEQRFVALVDHLTAVARDRKRLLLNIEFKLYAIRRPHRWKRLAELHRAMCMRCAEIHIDTLLPGQPGASARRKRSQAALLGTVLDGLTLNRLFDPSAMSKEQTRMLIRAGLEIALSVSRPPEPACSTR